MASEDEPIKTEKFSKKSKALDPDEKGKEKLEVNHLLNTKELKERNKWKENEDATPYLYPDLIEFTDIHQGINKTIDWFIDNYENCRK